jgi:hypothetical protein
MVTCWALLAMAASMASHANAPDPSTTTSCDDTICYSFFFTARIGACNGWSRWTKA